MAIGGTFLVISLLGSNLGFSPSISDEEGWGEEGGKIDIKL